MLEEWDLCVNTQVPSNVIELQLEKDKCVLLARVLENAYRWEQDDLTLQQAYDAFTPKLQQLQQRIIFEVLSNSACTKYQ